MNYDRVKVTQGMWRLSSAAVSHQKQEESDLSWSDKGDLTDRPLGDYRSTVPFHGGESSENSLWNSVSALGFKVVLYLASQKYEKQTKERKETVMNATIQETLGKNVNA